MAEIFTWKNSYADIYSYRYAPIAQEFLSLVVNPSLDALEAQLAVHENSDDPVSAFDISDLTELINKTRMAFCLSIQSIWERQIRTYLHGCQSELKLNPFPVSNRRNANSVHSVLWGDELNSVFFKLRGIPLTLFASYEKLDLLQLVGNVCRHGDGDSSNRLWRLHPEFWRIHHNNGDNLADRKAPSVEMMHIPRQLLSEFVDAICVFWDDMEYIYNESLSLKHHTVETKLAARWADPAKVMEFDGYRTAITKK
ncbi:hypothetical protein [Pseudomonas monteilii]|uniref:hypothetical protein n=1 Tax=Pseudomonas monteilii TaxID=76759 RepID=UPI000A66F73B|nr:hypothetical protein [Pseudomonas monteilii]